MKRNVIFMTSEDAIDLVIISTTDESPREILNFLNRTYGGTDKETERGYFFDQKKQKGLYGGNVLRQNLLGFFKNDGVREMYFYDEPHGQWVPKEFKSYLISEGILQTND